jgi:hypothetical protein
LTLARHFTNRDSEKELFFSAVQHPDPCIVNFYGRSGVGKSWLARHIFAECGLRSYPVVLINLQHEQDCDFLRIVTRVRRSAPPEWFTGVAKAIDSGLARLQTVYVHGLPEGQGATVDFGSGNTFTGSFSEVAIGGHVIKPTVVLPEYAQKQIFRELEDDVTEAFVSGLLECPPGSKVILLLDSFQVASIEMQKWLHGKLLARLLGSVSCPLKVALWGHSELLSAGECQCIVVNREVVPFDRESTREYISRRKPLSVEEQEFLFRITRGHPQTLALAIDNLEGGGGL